MEDSTEYRESPRRPVPFAIAIKSTGTCEVDMMAKAKGTTDGSKKLQLLPRGRYLLLDFPGHTDVMQLFPVQDRRVAIESE